MRIDRIKPEVAGKITAIGEEVEVPYDAMVVDVSGKVLLVDDEEIVRTTACRMLKRLERPGYAYDPPLPLGMFMAILLLIVGAFGFVAILLLVVVGGVIPPGDYDFLYENGAVGVFGPGTVVTDSANQVLNALDKKA